MNTQSQRAGGLQNLLANVGNKSGKRKIWAKIMYGFPLRKAGNFPVRNSS